MTLLSLFRQFDIERRMARVEDKSSKRESDREEGDGDARRGAHREVHVAASDRPSAPTPANILAKAASATSEEGAVGVVDAAGAVDAEGAVGAEDAVDAVDRPQELLRAVMVHGCAWCKRTHLSRSIK